MKDRVTEFQLECVDCIKGMRALPDKSVDLVVTSPPSNQDLSQECFDLASYLTWCREWASEVKRLLRGDGSFFLNVGSPRANQLFPHQVVLELKSLSLDLENTFHWIRSITLETADGKLVNADPFKTNEPGWGTSDWHEFIFHLRNAAFRRDYAPAGGVADSGRPPSRRSAQSRRNDPGDSGNTWFIQCRTINGFEEQPRPETLPVGLAVNCIRVHGRRPGLVMLDPFLGVGHSAVAALACGIKRFIGFDLNPTCIAAAREFLRKSAEPNPIAKRRPTR